MRAYTMLRQLHIVLLEANCRENPLQYLRALPYLQKRARDPSLYDEVCEICRVIVRHLA